MQDILSISLLVLAFIVSEILALIRSYRHIDGQIERATDGHGYSDLVVDLDKECIYI